MRFQRYGLVATALATATVATSFLFSVNARADFPTCGPTDPAPGCTFINNTGIATGSLNNLVFTGTGNNLVPHIITQPAACGASPQNNVNIGNNGTILWPTNCIPPGGAVTISFTTSFGPLSYVSGGWDANAGGGGVGNGGVPDAGGVTPITPLPALPPAGVAGLALTLLCGYYFIKARRRGMPV